MTKAFLVLSVDLSLWRASVIQIVSVHFELNLKFNTDEPYIFDVLH